MKLTRTFDTLEVSTSTYNEIAKKLKDAHYDAFIDSTGVINIYGVALIQNKALAPFAQISATTAQLFALDTDGQVWELVEEKTDTVADTVSPEHWAPVSIQRGDTKE